MVAQNSVLAGVMVFPQAKQYKSNRVKSKKTNKTSIEQLTSVSKEDRE